MSESKQVVAIPHEEQDIVPLMERSLSSVREELRDDPYIIEAIKVLQVGGYRSSIGSFWNAVVDDLRNKIIFRSLPLFNKSVEVSREIKTYEDFQNYVNDDQLIDGAYKIGVIGWEASKILRHAKETRHVFSGHPKSSQPSIIKVLAMMDDCIRYVLNAEYPPQLIDVDEYISTMASETFDRSEIAIESALGDLPEVYKNELGNRLLTSYIHPQASSVVRSNIEFVSPLLWKVLPKPIKIQITRRVDQEIQKGDANVTGQAFSFVEVVGSQDYLSTVARNYKIKPLVEDLESAFDDFPREDAAVRNLVNYSGMIPSELLPAYVNGLTSTYVGRIGSSSRYSRTDFYANGAAAQIPGMFEKFDDAAAQAFIDSIKSNEVLKRRIHSPVKLRRLRTLGLIVQDRISTNFSDKEILEALCDEEDEEIFFGLIA